MIENSLYSLVPLFALFAIFMIGFYYAWTDFRPRMIGKHENETFAVSRNSISEIIVKDKEYSLQELGIEELGTISMLPNKEQRHRKINETVRNYAIKSPELAASVVQKWLNEK